MQVKTILRCTNCNHAAFEYFGLEGGVYIGEYQGKVTPYECPQAQDKEKTHNFQNTNEQYDDSMR